MPDLDDLLEQLEEARDSGQLLAVEDLCADCPELIEPLKERWERLSRFDDRFGTRRESTAEVASKLSAMPEHFAGQRLVTQAELHVEQFHDRGGLGDVYRATEGELQREVAVKILRSDRQLPANLDDFKRESQIIGGLAHPGIVSIHGVGETMDGRPFYSMPFVDRGNLRAAVSGYHRKHRERVVENDKEFRDLVYRLVSVCNTIAYAHSRGIVHRDLKTENILLGKYGETFVIDWGCATRVDRDDRFKMQGEQTLQLRGVDDSNATGGLTLRYASPEQLHGRKSVGPESDIYSLGAMLYLLLSGESPLEQVPDEQVRRMVMSGGVPTCDAVKAGVPRRLNAICRKAMSVEPADRYATALDMAEDLERYLSDETVSVCKDSWGLRMTRVVRRNRTASMVLLGTLLAASLLLALAFAGQSVFARRAEASAQQRLRMAATLASNIGGLEIDRRISLLEREAANPMLVESLVAIEAEAANRDLWDRPQNLLYEFRDELAAAGVQLESMFLTDARGVQIARAPKSSSIGKSFAFRHYFHGLKQDLDPSSPEYLRNPPSPATGPVVSNAYVSSNTDRNGKHPIKTSFTVPVRLVVDRQGSQRVLGRLGMSLKINDLAVFKRLEELTVDALLIETRDYDWGTGQATGLILDRIHSDNRGFAVPENADLGTDDAAENEVKDSMPRLATSTIDALLGTMRESGEASLIPDFYDPRISLRARDAACAPLAIPYREDLQTGWTVLFIESASR